MPLSTCVISKTVKKPEDGLEYEGAFVAVHRASKAGDGLAIVPFVRHSNASGVLTITVPRDCTIYVSGDIDGLWKDASGNRYNVDNPKALAVPNAATANLDDLAAVASVPSTGLTMQDEGVALANLVGTLNVIGAGATLTQTSPGVAALTITGGGDVIGPSSSVDNALARFDLATGKLIQSSVGVLNDVGDLSGLGTVTATSFSGGGASLTSLNASNLVSGIVPDARFPTTLPAASGVNLTSLNASNLGSGTVPTARLGSGTANATTFLRGDQTWATVSASPGGVDTQVQFNDAGAFGGDGGLTYNKTTDVMTLTGALAIGTNPASAGPLRVPNNQFLTARNAGNSADINLIGLNTADRLSIAGGGQTSLFGGPVALGVSTTDKMFEVFFDTGNWIVMFKNPSAHILQLDGSGDDTKAALGIYSSNGAVQKAKITCAGNIHVGSSQVLTSRRSGWGTPTGTATRTAFDTSTVTLSQLAERVKALVDDLTTHGMIGA